MKTLAASLSILTREGVMLYLLRGVAFTCIISVLGVIMGLIVGSLLALARTYCKKGPARILGWFATAYIELFRNTPYLLWIFICVVFCPCPGFFARKMFGLTSVEMKLLFKAALALILFNSSVIAEIVRGGLNGVSKGQFEAGYAQGFNTAEVLLYIVLPQAYRNIVPTLLSQVITTIKDSSYLANVATIELMARIRQLLSAAGGSTGDEAVGHADEVSAAHDVEAGGVLEEVDHLVDHRREHHGDALGQDDVAHPLQIVEALSLCGLELALRHRLDGSADDLAHVSAGVNAQCNDAGADDAEAHACKCQRIIQEAQLQQQRGVLDELDVNAGDDAQQLTAAGGHQAQRSADDEGQRQCADGGLQRVAQTQQKTLTMRPDGGPGL